MWSWAHLAYLVLAAWRIFVCVCTYIYYFFFLHEMSLCLHPLELMQIFPLTSAGLGLPLSLHIAFQPCKMLLVWGLSIQSKQWRARSPPGCSQPSPSALYLCMSTAILHLPHPGPGEEKHRVSIPSARKDIGWRCWRWAELGHFRLLETSSPSPACSEAYKRHHQRHGASYWCVTVEAWPAPRGDLQMLVCLLDEVTALVLSAAGTELVSAPPAVGGWHHPALPCSCLAFISSFYSYCKHGRVHKKCSIRHDHLGRQVTVTSLLCLNIEHVLKNPNY